MSWHVSRCDKPIPLSFTALSGISRSATRMRVYVIKPSADNEARAISEGVVDLHGRAASETHSHPLIWWISMTNMILVIYYHNQQISSPFATGIVQQHNVTTVLWLIVGIISQHWLKQEGAHTFIWKKCMQIKKYLQICLRKYDLSKFI